VFSDTLNLGSSIKMKEIVECSYAQLSSVNYVKVTTALMHMARAHTTLKTLQNSQWEMQEKYRVVNSNIPLLF